MSGQNITCQHMVGDMSTHQTANGTGRFYSTTRTSTRVCSWPALLSPNVVSFYPKFRRPYGAPSSWKFHVCICSHCPYTTSWGPLRLDKTVWSGHTIWGIWRSERIWMHASLSVGPREHMKVRRPKEFRLILKAWKITKWQKLPTDIFSFHFHR